MADQVTFTVKDMTCEGCASKVRTALESSGKIISVDINVGEKEVQVSGTLSEKETFDLVKKAGYTPASKKKGWLDRIL